MTLKCFEEQASYFLLLVLNVIEMHKTQTKTERGFGVEASRFLKNATPTPGGLRPAKGVGISESAAIPAP